MAKKSEFQRDAIPYIIRPSTVQCSQGTEYRIFSPAILGHGSDSRIFMCIGRARAFAVVCSMRDIHALRKQRKFAAVAVTQLRLSAEKYNQIVIKRFVKSA